MNYVQIYIHFLLISTITTFLHHLYPCHYLDSNERILKCDICQCSSSPSVSLTSNLCLLASSFICTNNSNEQSQSSLQSEKNFEFDHFNNDILNNLFQSEQFCSTINASQITFFYLIYNVSSNQILQCVSTINSLHFINSYIENNSLFKDINIQTLTFYNTTFHINNFNLTLTKKLIFHSVEFLQKSFELNSLLSLTDLTITHINDYNLTGSFPQLSYLNLCHTKLNDKKLNKLFSQLNLPDLITMILSNNQLTIITNKFPSTIRYLDLSNNQIKFLDYYSFKSLYSLNILNLSYNSPLEIQQDTFTRIPYLEILDLSSCLPTLSFDDLFLPLQKLRHLNISGNYLDILPHLPTPHDAHAVESYDHHLPVLYVDISNNHFEKIDLEFFSSSSTQDKYILSLNMNTNHIKTFKFPLTLLNDTKRRRPFIELNINNNPLECDCNLYENIFHLFKNDSSYQNERALSSTSPFQQPPPSGFHPLPHLRANRQINMAQQTLSTNILSKQNRIKLLHLSNLTCIDMIEPTNHRFLVDLDSSNSFCSYRKSCPWACSCKQSFDLTNNYVNCSTRQLNQIPLDIPSSATHLYLDNNQIKLIEHNLTYLTNLKYLSLANNSLEYLSDSEFESMMKMEYLDLSSNHIQNIGPKLFSNLFNLKQLYLHNNPWIPKFYNENKEFQTNTRLILLTYANGSSCKRSTISSSTIHEMPLTAEDCCKYSNTESCQQTAKIYRNNLEHDSTKSQFFFASLFHQKFHLYILIGMSILIIFSILIFYLYRKKRSLFSNRKSLSNNHIKIPVNHYHKPLIYTRQKGLNSKTVYVHQENDISLSLTDEDDYASIPLTISHSDLTLAQHSQANVPPLPPPRRILFNRPNSHSSTVSTSITIQSLKSPNSSLLIPTRSCLQIKLDVLVLYSINDSEYVHEHVGYTLEYMYGKRFSFHFIHRDRMLGELDWLIENSCVTILILRKPYHLIHEYMKILSSSSIKCFIIIINHDQRTSIKVREKIARLYRTSNIYEWNSNPNSLTQEQLELFLEQNCGSATYVTD